MIDLKLTPKRLKEHWWYYRWRYVVFTLIALVGANLLFTATKPQTPPEKRVDILIIADYASTDTAEKWQAELLALLPKDQKEANIITTLLVQGQEMTMMQLMAARMAAGEGTIWILPSPMFQGLAQGGAFMKLDKLIGSFKLPKGADISKTRLLVGKDDKNPGQVELCGIPLDECKGLQELIIPKDMVMCFPIYADKNWDNAVFAANWLLQKTELPPQLQPSASPGATAAATASAK